MGRKAKPKLTQRELEDEVIYKYMCGEPLTLEEAAIALHMYDNAHGIKSKKPLTKMGFLKLEARILEKLRKACEAQGFTKREVLEMLQELDSCKRTSASGTYDNSID